MINESAFLSGYVVYKIDSSNVKKFLKEVEMKTNLRWRSEDKPTEFIPPEGTLDELKDIELDFDIIIGVAKPHTSEACLQYMWDSNYINLSSLDDIKIEIYE